MPEAGTVAAITLTKAGSLPAGFLLSTPGSHHVRKP
jgi:hypothetical protein